MKLQLEGKRAKVIKSLSTVGGTLYSGDEVLIERKENGNWRCKDMMGRIFYMPESNLKVVNKK